MTAFAMSYAVVVGIFAYVFCFTLNEGALGGFLPFAFITCAPLICTAIGYLSAGGNAAVDA